MQQYYRHMIKPNIQMAGRCYAGGTKVVTITPERACILASLRKPNGKPVSERATVERVLGSATDGYYKYLLGGNGLVASVTGALGWND